jgi:hypothetical protein
MHLNDYAAYNEDVWWSGGISPPFLFSVSDAGDGPDYQLGRESRAILIGHESRRTPELVYKVRSEEHYAHAWSQTAPILLVSSSSRQMNDRVKCRLWHRRWRQRDVAGVV